MNTNHSFLVVILYFFLSVSCSTIEINFPKETENLKDYTEDLFKDAYLTVKASLGEDGADTKTVIHSNRKIYWSPGDCINLFYGTYSSGMFHTNITSPSSTATFYGSVSVTTGANETGLEAKSFWGVYPYDVANTCDGSSVTMTFLAEQKPVADSFQNGANPSLAKSDNLDLAFYNVGSWLMFSVSESGILSATLSGNNNEDLAGTVRVTMTDGRPVVSEVIGGEKSIEINAPAGGFVPGRFYYVTIIPQTLVNGYTLHLNKVKYEGDCVVSGSKSFVRNQPRAKQDADTFVGSWIEKEIPFSDLNVKEICLANFDSNGDGKLLFSEAEAVTSLGTLFKNNTNITSFDELQYFTGLSYFTMYGFQGCTNLRTITLPPSVELNWYLFDGCTSLERIVFLSDFTKIPKYAFRNCSSLVNIDIPSTVTEIGEYAFNGCSALRDVVLPEGFNNLGSYAFDGCSSITSITIPVRNISVCAFRNCTSLTTVSLANTEYIGNGAFSGCTQLRTINIPSSVSQIGGEAFFMCDITSFVVPEGVTEIRTATFQKCYNLRTISIPSTMETINGYVFWDCTSLERVDVHATLCTLGSGNFNSVVPDIYVPSGRGTAYRGFSGWSAFADHIFEF